MATMEMGKASALLNSRIIFKLFHSNSNYNLHFFLYFLGLQMKHVERTKNSLKMLTNKYQLHNLGHKLKLTVETLFVVDK